MARSRRSSSASAKIRDKAQLLAGAALQAPAESLQWSNGAWVTSGDSAQVKTIEDLALYAHGSGELPPGRRGRPRRPDGLSRLRRQADSGPASSTTSTSSATFSAPNSAE